MYKCALAMFTVILHPEGNGGQANGGGEQWESKRGGVRKGKGDLLLLVNSPGKSSNFSAACPAQGSSFSPEITGTL